MRTPACESEDIAKRIAELRAERDALRNCTCRRSDDGTMRERAERAAGAIATYATDDMLRWGEISARATRYILAVLREQAAETRHLGARSGRAKTVAAGVATAATERAG